MDSAIAQSDRVTIRGSWLVPASRAAVYAIASDFARMPENFPRLARSIRIISSDGNRLIMEAEAASFGRLFPRVVVSMEAELFPERGYRCSTFNRTFKTSGREEMLLRDAPGGAQLQYTYIVTVKYKWLCPLFGWMARVFGLPYWKRHYLTPLTNLAQEYQRGLQAGDDATRT